jgi:hypothetical protein
MLCQRQIILDHAQGGGIDRNKANLTPLAVNPKMHDAFTGLKIFQAQSAEFLAPDAVIKQRRLVKQSMARKPPASWPIGGADPKETALAEARAAVN